MTRAFRFHRFPTLLVALLALVALPILAEAQKASTHPKKPKPPVVKPPLAPLVQATRDLREAVSDLHAALPIYDIYRLRAGKMAILAHRQIIIAASAKTHPGAKLNTVRDILPVTKDEGHDRGKYTGQKVAASQAKLQDAEVKLKHSIEAMGSLAPAAALDLKQAIEDIEKAISIQVTA